MRAAARPGNTRSRSAVAASACMRAVPCPSASPCAPPVKVVSTPCAPGSEESTGICKSASPTTYIDANNPPFYIAHSDDDPVVPVSQGRYMRDVLKAANVDVTYHEVTGLKHGWHALFNDAQAVAVRDEVVAWLKARK